MFEAAQTRHGLYHELGDISFPCVYQSYNLRCDTAEIIAAVNYCALPHTFGFLATSDVTVILIFTVVIVSRELEESSGIVGILCVGKENPRALTAPKGNSFTRKLLVEIRNRQQRGETYMAEHVFRIYRAFIFVYQLGRNVDGILMQSRRIRPRRFRLAWPGLRTS